MNRIFNRLYADFLMPSRMTEYRHLLAHLKENAYAFHSIASFHALVRNGGPEAGTKYAILRHDIDTDPEMAAIMWQQEQELGVRSSYYFRLTTLDTGLMKHIHASGSEASYHYEEIADHCKQHRIRTAAEAERRLPEIQERFLSNLERLRRETGIPMNIVASHGDFVNRILSMPNWKLLEDVGFRKRAGIDLEVYDRAFMQHVTHRHSDAAYPKFWNPSDPLNSVREGAHVLYLLVHPRHWRSNIKVNLADDITRITQGIKYKA